MDRAALIQSFLIKAQHKVDEISKLDSWNPATLSEIYKPNSNFPGTFWLASFLETEKTEHMIKWKSYLNSHPSIAVEADIVKALNELIKQKQDEYTNRLLPETINFESQLKDLKNQKMAIQREKEHEKEKSNKDKVAKLAQDEEHIAKKIEIVETQILQHHSVWAQCRAMSFLLQRL